MGGEGGEGVVGRDGVEWGWDGEFGGGKPSATVFGCVADLTYLSLVRQIRVVVKPNVVNAAYRRKLQ